jgi:hypothetical protein
MLSTGFGDLENHNASRPHSTENFALVSNYGGYAWETFGSAGLVRFRFANPRMAATLFVWRRSEAVFFIAP